MRYPIWEENMFIRKETDIPVWIQLITNLYDTKDSRKSKQSQL